MKHLKIFNKLNEKMTPKELEEELKSGATWIEPALIGNLWGVIYHKNGEKHEEGLFNTSAEVYKFLTKIGVYYKGKSGFDMMSKYREREIEKLPFQKYQRYLMQHGLEDFDIE